MKLPATNIRSQSWQFICYGFYSTSCLGILPSSCTWPTVNIYICE